MFEILRREGNILIEVRLRENDGLVRLKQK